MTNDFLEVFQSGRTKIESLDDMSSTNVSENEFAMVIDAKFVTISECNKYHLSFQFGLVDFRVKVEHQYLDVQLAQLIHLETTRSVAPTLGEVRLLVYLVGK
jgi:hypothetical protein